MISAHKNEEFTFNTSTFVCNSFLSKYLWPFLCYSVTAFWLPSLPFRSGGVNFLHFCCSDRQNAGCTYMSALETRISFSLCHCRIFRICRICMVSDSILGRLKIIAFPLLFTVTFFLSHHAKCDWCAPWRRKSTSIIHFVYFDVNFMLHK